MSAPTIHNQKLTPLAALATAALCVIFGANFVAIKLSLGGLGVFTCATLRFGVGALLIALLARLRGQSLRLERRMVRPVLLLCAVFTVQIALFYVGLDKTHASRGTLISNLQPFVVLVLAHYFIPGDRITLPKLAGIVLGFTGVFLVFSGGETLGRNLRIGDTVVLAAVLIWSANAVYTKRIISALSAYQISFYPMAFSLPFLAGAALLWDHPSHGPIGSTVIGSLLYQIIMATALGWCAWNALFQKYGAVAMSSYLFLQPITGVILGGLMLGEPTRSTSILLALPLVLIGSYVANRTVPDRWRQRFLLCVSWPKAAMLRALSGGLGAHRRKVG